MARVIYDGREVDQNFQIEDGIRRGLDHGRRAVVETKVIENSYDLVDDNGNLVADAELNVKCLAIAREVNARFTVDGERVFFQAAPEAAVSRRVVLIAGGTIIGTVGFDSLRADATFKAICEPRGALNEPQLATLASDLVANKVCGWMDDLEWHAD